MTDNYIQDDHYWATRPFLDQHFDWKIYDEKNWIEGYWKSVDHPHRKMIIDAISKLMPMSSLLEVGCNCGPNLRLIQMHFPEIILTGADINADVINEAKLNPELNKVHFYVRNLKEPWLFKDRVFDLVLADAVLMYIEPEKIREVLKEFAHVAQKAIIIIDWYNPFSLLGKLKEYHWTRNYPKLLKEIGFETEKIKITHDLWPSQNWSTLGHLFIARRA